MPTDAELVADAPKVVSADEAMTAAADVTNLPPAGDARRDELKRRSDQLRAAADQLAQAAGVEAIDLSKVQPENEIAQHFDPLSGMLAVTNRLPEYEYRWEQADIRNQFGNTWVTTAKALGWEIVSGPMPESMEHRAVDSTRRVGDVILMRIRKERYDALMARQRRINIARSEGVGVQLLEQAERAGVPLHDLTSPSAPAHLVQHAQAQLEAGRAARAAYVRHTPQARSMRGAAASEIASRKLDRMIRGGTVPGLTPA
jgi:hypothetical protein